MRKITKKSLLYTEMITTGALLKGDTQRFLDFHLDEKPVAIQLGGSTPHDLAACATLAENEGYDQINLNVGCPSDRVKNGRFGACLMAEPNLVGDCVAAMKAQVKIPVTIKTRIGIDDLDSYDYLCHFINVTQKSGCDTYIIHARKAWLSGLSPKENREIPPLRYEIVEQIKREFPHLDIIINGGIQSLDAAKMHLQSVDGVMLGRIAYYQPFLLANVDTLFYDVPLQVFSQSDVIESMADYIHEELKKGTRLHHITRHMLGLFQGQPGGKRWRRYLSEHANHPHANMDTLKQACITAKFR
jgi:tRNA-dihydrouridine synthase A